MAYDNDNSCYFRHTSRSLAILRKILIKDMFAIIDIDMFLVSSFKYFYYTLNLFHLQIERISINWTEFWDSYCEKIRETRYLDTLIDS